MEQKPLQSYDELFYEWFHLAFKTMPEVHKRQLEEDPVAYINFEQHCLWAFRVAIKCHNRWGTSMSYITEK